MSTQPPRYSDFSPTLLKRLWTWFAIILLATLIANAFVPLHGHFGLDATPFFFAWYGFASCAAIVIFSKCLGLLLKRPQDYYVQQSRETR